MTITSYSNTDYRSLVDDIWFDLVQDYSGRDNIIEYHLLEPSTGYSTDDWGDDYYTEKWEFRNVLSFSQSEAEFIRFAFDELGRLTGATFRESGFQDGILNMIKVDKYLGEDADFGGLTSVANGWYDISYVDDAGDQLTDWEKSTIWHEIGHALGLDHPNKEAEEPNFNLDITVMSYNEVDFEPIKLRPLDIEALRNLWGQTTSPPFQYGVDPTLPTLTTIESTGNTHLFQDADGYAYVKKADYENLLELTDYNGAAYKINNPDNWSILAAETIDGKDQVLWGYFETNSYPSEYQVWEQILWDGYNSGTVNYHLAEENEIQRALIGSDEFVAIADDFGLGTPSTPTPTQTPDPNPPIPAPAPNDDYFFSNPIAETISNIDVPVNKKWSKYLWKKSGKDGIIDYYADKKGKLDKKQNTKIAKKTLSFIDDMLDEVESILGLDFNKAKKSNQADIIFQAKSKSKDASTYKTKYGMEVSFSKTQKKPTQYDMQDINYLTGYALGLKNLKGNSYDAADSVMAANYSDEYLGWSNNDIKALQSIW